MTRQPGALIQKDPQSIEPYGFDWTDWLEEISGSETISTSTWAVTGSDSVLTLSGASIVTGSTKTQVKLNAGTVGVRYTVTNSIITSSGLRDDRSFFVLVQQR